MSERFKFERAIAGMQIPEDRRPGTPENARWFLHNGALLNRGHPNILLAICHARRIAEQPTDRGMWRNWKTRRA